MSQSGSLEGGHFKTGIDVPNIGSWEGKKGIHLLKSLSSVWCCLGLEPEGSLKSLCPLSCLLFSQGHWAGLSSLKWNYKLHIFYWFMRNILKYCDFSSSEKYFDDSVCHPPYNSVSVYCELEGKMSSCGWVRQQDFTENLLFCAASSRVCLPLKQGWPLWLDAKEVQNPLIFLEIYFYHDQGQAKLKSTRLTAQQGKNTFMESCRYSVAELKIRLVFWALSLILCAACFQEFFIYSIECLTETVLINETHGKIIKFH